MGNLTRRAFVATAAGAAGAGVAAWALPSPVSANAGRPIVCPTPTPTVTPPPGGGVVCGATVSTYAFPSGTTPAQAYQAWANVMGTVPGGAKEYFQGASTWPTSSLNTKLLALKALGIMPVVCMQPAPGGADSAAMAKSMAYLQSQFPKGIVVFWQEQDHGSISVANFKSCYATYTPVVHSAAPGWQTYYDASGALGTTALANYYPGQAACDGIAIDCYATNRQYQTVANAAASLADANGQPFGWFEIGVQGGGNSEASQAAGTAYMGFITNLVTGRRSAGKPCGPFMYWNGPTAVGVGKFNSIVPVTVNPQNHYLIPLWQNFIKACS